MDLSSELFRLKGTEGPLCDSDFKTLEQCRQLSERVFNLLGFFLKTQAEFLASMCKFSYVTQRIFLYLIYQGFCGKDEQNDEEQQAEQDQDDKYLDGDGCGMGDGEGQQNVSNEIENEEQLEGLKNYESEEE